MNKKRLMIAFVAVMLVFSMVTTVNAGNPWDEVAARFDEVWAAINDLLIDSGVIQSSVAAMEATITEQTNTITSLEAENSELRAALSALESRVALIEHSPPQGLPAYDTNWLISPIGGVVDIKHMLGTTDIYVYVMGKTSGMVSRLNEVSVLTDDENMVIIENIPANELIRVLIWRLPGPIEGENNPPIAQANAAEGFEGNPIFLNGFHSYDPDGDPLQYRWDFENDGVWDTDWSPEHLISHIYTDDMSGTYRLEVSDGELTSDATAWLTVNNMPPNAEIIGYEADGNSVTFHAEFSDPGDDTWVLTWLFEFDEINWEEDYISEELIPESYVNPLGEREITWSPEQEAAVNEALNPTHVYPGPGTYRVMFVVWDDDSFYTGEPGFTQMLITIP